MADIGIPRRDCELPSCGLNFQPVRKGQAFHSNACRLALYTQARTVGLEIFKVWGRFPTVTVSELEALFMMDLKTRKFLTEIEGAEKEIKYHKGKVKEYTAEKDSSLLELMRLKRQEESGQGDLFEQPPAEQGLETFEVDQARFADDGDMVASVSADVLDSGKVRKPFEYEGIAYAAIGGVCSGARGWYEIKAYRIIPVSDFEGEAHKPGEIDSEALREQPEGSCHGMLVEYRKTEYVLVGPPVKFVPKGAAEEDPGEPVGAGAPDAHRHDVG